MSQVNMLEAKSSLSKLVERVASGQENEIIIARNGKPARCTFQCTRRQMPVHRQQRPGRPAARSLLSLTGTQVAGLGEVKRPRCGRSPIHVPSCQQQARTS